MLRFSNWNVQLNWAMRYCSYLEPKACAACAIETSASRPTFELKGTRMQKMTFWKPRVASQHTLQKALDIWNCAWRPVVPASCCPVLYPIANKEGGKSEKTTATTALIIWGKDEETRWNIIKRAQQQKSSKGMWFRDILRAIWQAHPIDEYSRSARCAASPHHREKERERERPSIDCSNSNTFQIHEQKVKHIPSKSRTSLSCVHKMRTDNTRTSIRHI